MSKVDLVVFGATGYTGKRAVEELVRGGQKYVGTTWAIAGRSQKKLEDLLTEMSNKTGEDLSSVEMIVADVEDYPSLTRMCNRAKVVVNACGPYRLYGEPVVQACVECKVHYVDVSGEPVFIETMQMKYDKAARAAEIYIISACGLDSIPNDMGVIFLDLNFNGTLNTVESYLSSTINPEYAWEAFRSGSINYGTWESLIYSLANFGDLEKIRGKVYPLRINETLKPRLESRGWVHRRLGGWCVPFLGADKSVVYRTQRALCEEQRRPVQFKPYIKLNSLLQVLLLAIFGSVILLFSKFAFTRNILLNHPRIFSCGMVSRGPKRDVTENTKFELTLLGRGWSIGQKVESTPPEHTITAKVSAMDPGYGFTALALVQSAATILRDYDRMPPPGGVMTTGYAFRRTNLIRKLQESNVTFEIVDKKDN